jgi:hypothetical protein
MDMQAILLARPGPAEGNNRRQAARGASPWRQTAVPGHTGRSADQVAREAGGMRDAQHEAADGAAARPVGARRSAFSDLIAGLTGRNRSQDYLNGRRTMRGRIQGHIYRHPLLSTTIVALFMVWVTIGLIFRIAQARDTVHSGWAVAVVAGLVIGAAPVAVIIRLWRGPYGRAFVGAASILLVLYVFGLAACGQLLFEGWVRVQYVIASPLQVAAITWTLPATAAVATLLAGILVFYLGTLAIRRRRQAQGRQL